MLREQGCIFYCPEVLWQAYHEGLLKNRYVYKYLKAVPERVQRKFANFLIGQTVKDGVVQEAAPLPEPAFTRQADWKIVLAHCGIKGVGAGKSTKSRHYQSLYIHSDGSVSELVKLPIHLTTDICGCLPEIRLPGGQTAYSRLEELFGWRFRGREEVSMNCFLIIQTDFFSKQRLTKLRRRVEDQLRKGHASDIVRVAKSLGC